MEVSQALKLLPHRPGVYLFRDTQNHVIYIGKAIDLARRVRSYRSAALFSHIADIETIETISEFDALLLEAKLIRQFKPKYNVITRDDKSPLYVILTLSEPLPRILFVRKTHVKKRGDTMFGPFQSARMLRSVMRQLRSIVPYCLQKQRNGKSCFYTHLGLCRPCPSVLAKTGDSDQIKKYRKNILRLKNVLDGNAHLVLDQLEKEMKTKASVNQFEEAGSMQKQMTAYYSLLSRRYDPSVYLEHGVGDVYRGQLEDLQHVLLSHIANLKTPSRIECVDISNISGLHATGSLVVLSDGRIDKSQYKRFRIQTVRGSNDPAMIEEVVLRRFKHSEWPLPDLLVIDGGKAQVRASAIAPVPVIGLAKRLEEVIIPKKNGFTTLRLSLNSPALHVLQRIRDEAHRFALNYHRHLRFKTGLKPRNVP